jgi:nitrogen fixation protein FixH
MTSLPSERRLTGRTVLITLLVFFGIVISVNMTMMKLAIDTLSGTEVDSAYRASLAFKSEIAAAREQERRGWRIDAHVERNVDGVALVAVEARDRAGAPLSGVDFTVRLARPTDKRADRTIALAERNSGIFRGAASDIGPGQWDLIIEAEGAAGRLFLSTTRVVLN